MGMAASQARLLTITSRLHDVELRAQNIESQKIALATQKDELYQNYCDALDAKKIQVAFVDASGCKTFVDANFANVAKYDPSRVTQFSLRDSKTGKVIVDDETADMYDYYKSDKYMFAWAMMGYDGYMSDDDDYAGEFVGRDNQDNIDLLDMCGAEREVFEAHKDDEKYSKLKQAHEDFENAENIIDRKKALQNFRDVLYSDIALRAEIHEKICAIASQDSVYDPSEAPDIDMGEFNFYVHLFENIQNNGGCVKINAVCEDGDSGNEWFNNMVQSGRVLIDVYDNTGKNKGWTETSVATSTSNNYLQEVSDDTDLKKAEAEYEHELSIINRKDTKFDKELSKLETERNALKTEYDSIKKVKEENVERTFGIFS